MSIFIILLIMISWLFSIYFFASWRIRSKKQGGGIFVNALNDGATHLYVMASGVALLVLIIYLI